MHRRFRDDEGLAIIIVALALVVLLVSAAFVVDLGNARQTKRRTQNAIDAAALAAASEYQGSTATFAAARTRVAALLAPNEFANSTATGDLNVRNCGNGESCVIRVTFCNYLANSGTCTPPTGTAPAQVAGNKFCVQVAIEQLRVPTRFAPAIGVDNLFVTAEANGCKRFGSSGTGTVNFPAAQSLGTCPNPNESFATKGDNLRFIGGVESAESVDDDLGDNTTYTGTRRYRVAPPSPDKLGDLWAGLAPQPGPVVDPLAQAQGQTNAQIVAAYGPGGARRNEAVSAQIFNNTLSTGGPPQGSIESNDLNLTSPLYAGVYYTTGNITLGNPNIGVLPRTVGGVTYQGVILIAAGSSSQINISGNNARLTPLSGGTIQNPNRITIIAGRPASSTSSQCSDTGLILSGQCVRVDGIMYVPFTRVTFSNNGNGHGGNYNGDADESSDTNNPGGGCTPTDTYRGSLLAQATNLDGNNHLLRGGTGTGSTTTPEVFLDA